MVSFVVDQHLRRLGVGKAAEIIRAVLDFLEGAVENGGPDGADVFLHSLKLIGHQPGAVLGNARAYPAAFGGSLK